MDAFQKTKEKMLEAVAAARDEALMKVGKDAESRQSRRISTTQRAKIRRVAKTAMVAGGAIMAGTVVVRAMRRKKFNAW